MSESKLARLYREALEDGYIQCICGEFAVGMHGSCRMMMTDEDYKRWSDMTDRKIKLYG
jgi:hypothetical protein